MNIGRAPPSGASRYGLFSPARARNFRSGVIGSTFAAGIWSLLWAIGAFQEVSTDNNTSHKLGTIAIALGALYLGVFVIQLLGMTGAILRRVVLVRIFVYLQVLAAIIVIGTGFLRTIIHFTFKTDLINECVAQSTGETVEVTFGIWGPVSSQTLSKDDATNFCNNAWSHDSFTEIITLIAAILLGVLFPIIAFRYLRQLLDPTSPENVSRAPSNQARMGASARYNPPYDANYNVPNLGYSAPQYAPPPGPPPRHSDEFVPPYDGKLPGYGVGMGNDLDKTKYAESQDGKDPFADFDGPSQI